MAKVHGKNLEIDVNSIDLTGDSNEVTLDINVGSDEVSTFEDGFDTFVQGTPNWTVQMNGVWDGADDDLDEQMFTLVTAGGVTMNLYPEANTNGKVKYTGTVQLLNYNVPVSRAGAVRWSANFQGSGTLSRSYVTT